MISLNGKIALGTDASRGVGKGIALGLGEAGDSMFQSGVRKLAGLGMNYRKEEPLMFSQLKHPMAPSIG